MDEAGKILFNYLDQLDSADSSNPSNPSSKPANQRANPPTANAQNKKQKLKEVEAEIDSLEDLEFESLQLNGQAAQLHLPPDLDVNNPYSLFTLSFSEKMFDKSPIPPMLMLNYIYMMMMNPHYFKADHGGISLQQKPGSPLQFLSI